MKWQIFDHTHSYENGIPLSPLFDTEEEGRQWLKINGENGRIYNCRQKEVLPDLYLEHYRGYTISQQDYFGRTPVSPKWFQIWKMGTHGAVTSGYKSVEDARAEIDRWLKWQETV